MLQSSAAANVGNAITRILQEWAREDFPLADEGFVYKGLDANGKTLKPIKYKELDLNGSWQTFDITHELTTKGIEKFVADYKNTLKK